MEQKKEQKWRRNNVEKRDNWFWNKGEKFPLFPILKFCSNMEPKEHN